jgi:hypothetical protein
MTQEVPQPHDNAFFFAIKFGSGSGMSEWGNSVSKNGSRSLQQIRANLRRTLQFFPPKRNMTSMPPSLATILG